MPIIERHESYENYMRGFNRAGNHRPDTYCRSIEVLPDELSRADKEWLSSVGLGGRKQKAPAVGRRTTC